MRRKTIAAVLIIITILLTAPQIGNTIIVHDPIRAASFIKKHARVLLKFVEYKILMDEFFKHQRFMNRNAFKRWFGIDPAALNQLFDETFMEVFRALASESFYGHSGRSDPWESLYSGKKIQDHYPALNIDTQRQLMEKDLLYQTNPTYREFQQQNLENYRKYLEHLELQIQMIADLREADSQMGAKIEQYRQRIDEANSKNGATANISNIESLKAAMTADLLKQDLQMQALIEALFLNDDKNKIINADTIRRRRLLRDRDKNKENYLREMKK